MFNFYYLTIIEMPLGQIHDNMVQDMAANSSFIAILFTVLSLSLVFFIAFTVRLYVKNKKNEAYVESCSQGAWTLNVRSSIFEYTPVCYSILGYDIGEFGSKLEDWFDLFHPDDFDPIRRFVLEKIDDGLPFLIHYRVKTKLGDWLWLRTKATVIEWEKSGKAKIIQGHNEDIDELQNYKHSLTEERERLNMAMDAARISIWEWDLVSDRFSPSETFFEITGYTQEEINKLGSWIELIHSDELEKVNLLLKKHLDGDSSSFRCEFRIKAKDERWLWFEASARVVQRYVNGDPIKMLGMVHDISEKEMLEEQLHQSQKMEAIGQLTGGVAHDFNNLLQAIIGFGQMVYDDLPEDSSLRDDMNQILAAGNRAQNLNRQLLTFSRKGEFSPQDLKLHDVITNLMKMVTRVIGAHIEFNFEPEENQVELIHADQGQLEQIIMNLCVNARDAMPHGGRINIRTYIKELNVSDLSEYHEGRVGKFMVMEVKDNGTGIPDSIIDKIFEPFFTTKGEGKGTGLGLANVSNIIKRHDGFFKIYTNESIGTTFEIFFPVVEKHEQAEAVESKTKEINNDGCEAILLAEDDIYVSQVAVSILRKAGYRVFLAQDGASAIDMYRELKDTIDLVVLDVMMPKKNGREVYDYIKGVNSSQSVLFCSGYTNNLLKTDYMVEIPEEILQKPYTKASLLEKVRNILDEKKGIVSQPQDIVDESSRGFCEGNEDEDNKTISLGTVGDGITVKDYLKEKGLLDD